MENIKADEMGEARRDGYLDRAEGGWCCRIRRIDSEEERPGKKSKECDYWVKDAARQAISYQL